MASGRERPCVAINHDGSVAMHFSTIKDAAWGLGVPLGSMHRIMAKWDENDEHHLRMCLECVENHRFELLTK